jgi:hypothetical protein
MWVGLLYDLHIFVITICWGIVLCTLSSWGFSVSDRLTWRVPYSMEQSPSWEADQSLQPVKKFPEFLWNPKALYRTHKWPPPVPILSQLHPVPTTPSPTSWRSILILSSHLHLGHPNGIFPSGFLTNTLCTPLSSPIRHQECQHI